MTGYFMGLVHEYTLLAALVKNAVETSLSAKILRKSLLMTARARWEHASCNRRSFGRLRILYKAGIAVSWTKRSWHGVSGALVARTASYGQVQPWSWEWASLSPFENHSSTLGRFWSPGERESMRSTISSLQKDLECPLLRTKMSSSWAGWSQAQGLADESGTLRRGV